MVTGRFRKLPIEIEAFKTHVPMTIKTLEGAMTASIGDWIITGVRGETYPCKDDIFRATYKGVDVAAIKMLEPDDDRTKPAVNMITDQVSGLISRIEKLEGGVFAKAIPEPDGDRTKLANEIHELRKRIGWPCGPEDTPPDAAYNVADLCILHKKRAEHRRLEALFNKPGLGPTAEDHIRAMQGELESEISALERNQDGKENKA